MEKKTMSKEVHRSSGIKEVRSVANRSEYQPFGE